MGDLNGAGSDDSMMRARRQRRVMIVTHTARLGGAEYMLLRFCTSLRDSSYSVRVVCLESGPLVDHLAAAGVDVDVVPGSAAALRTGRSETRDLASAVSLVSEAARSAARVSRLAVAWRADLIQSWTLKTHLITALAGPWLGLPVVWFLHDRVSDEYLGRLNRHVIRLLSRLPAAVIANSRATASTLPRHCDIAYPGLAPNQFLSPSDVAARYPVSPPELLMLGRISPTKGQLEAIQAMFSITRRFPEVKLQVVGSATFGEEDYEVACRLLVSELGLEQSVIFCGASPDPRWALDRATALVHASPIAEPFGQVITEAMARGVPVIATSAGGVPEILMDGTNQYGCLVPPGDVAGLANAVTEVLESPGQAATRASAAYQRALSEFSMPATVSAVTDVWARVLQGSRSSASFRVLGPR